MSTTPATVAELRQHMAHGIAEAAAYWRAAADEGLNGAAAMADRLEKRAAELAAMTESK